jgi:hypothetical protein
MGSLLVQSILPCHCQLFPHVCLWPSRQPQNNYFPTLLSSPTRLQPPRPLRRPTASTPRPPKPKLSCHHCSPFSSTNKLVCQKDIDSRDVNLIINLIVDATLEAFQQRQESKRVLGRMWSVHLMHSKCIHFFYHFACCFVYN